MFEMFETTRVAPVGGHTLPPQSRSHPPALPVLPAASEAEALAPTSAARRRAVVVGASAGVGRALAEELAQASYDLLLVATGGRDLDALARDLRLRFGVSVDWETLDLADPGLDFAATVERWWRGGRVAAVLLPVGSVHDGDDQPADAGLLDRTLRINYTAPAAIAGQFAKRFRDCGSGDIVGFSSIAAAAPRGRNMAYASAKAALETYFAALRHHLAGTPVRVQVYVLGYVDTSMSFGKKLLLPVATPQSIARAAVSGFGRDVGKVHRPRFWWLVTRILRALPWSVFRRLQF